ncbi:hypothetical protein QBZ16_002865 [Prototheca wickerhamii]|uniref:Mitochondrial GTPase 1 n=1 Tax=Prototheca wickerhamii TaxID=3111 RepID=A0AAD9IIJ2_PROWI|nr:hypothetical protein QBZ16_002865 [Prototheca wickerhamii]
MQADWDDLQKALQPQQKGATIQWYPGHVAAAERELKRRLEAVDVVIEVRDGRCPRATAHPMLPKWSGKGSTRLVLLNRADMIEPEDRRAWSLALEAERGAAGGAVWTNGRLGAGVEAVLATLRAAAAGIDARRARRGLRPRPVRAAVVGFPNVGKSALINRLLGRRARESAARPGEAAAHLAACDDIGAAGYEALHVAAALLETLRRLPRARAHLRALQRCYGLAWPDAESGEAFLHELARRRFNDEPPRAAERVLRDFRELRLGKICLELPRS